MKFSMWAAVGLAGQLFVPAWGQADEAAGQPVRQAVTPITSAPATEPTSAPASEPTSAPTSSLPRVALEIAQGGEDWGRVVVELRPDLVPITAENFLQYVDDSFYDGTVFHRVIPGFIIQGGGYTSSLEPQRTGLRRPIRCEAKNGLKNLRGTIAMARARNAISATSQFFINLEDNANLDYPSRDGWGYCAFGTVVEGLEIVERIRDVPTQHASSGVDHFPSQPVDPPVIKRAYRLTPMPATRPAQLPPLEPPPTEPQEYNQESTPESIPAQQPRS